MFKITTQHGEFQGKNAESIIRREYGRSAYLRYSGDVNSPEVGMVVRDNPNTGSGWSAGVLATVIRAE